MHPQNNDSHLFIQDMPKKFSTRKLAVLSRTARRRRALKVAPKTFHIQNTFEKQNKPMIDRLEASLKAS